jgi:hypothetical protein
MKDLERCRISLEQWVYYVVARLDVVPDSLRDVIELFFLLPSGPNSTNSNGIAVYDPSHSQGSNSSINNQQQNGNNDYDEYDDTESVADSTTSSVYTASVMDEQGNKLPKKKKRIIKGAKKRLSNILGIKKKESFGVDFSGMPSSDDGTNKPSSVMSATASQSGSTTGSVTSNGDSGANKSQVQKVQPGVLLKTRVIRGGERSKGQTEYDVSTVLVLLVL